MIAPYVTHNGHAIKPRPALTECEHHVRVLELTVDLLIARSNKGDCWSEGFLDAETLLAALPFATAEFGLAIGRLRNALAYCREKEFGAAAFELRALRGCLLRL